MTNESKLIAISEACGWKPQTILRCHKCDTCYDNPENKEYPAGVLCPECKKNGFTMVGVCYPEPIPGSDVPDYLDLNVMHEAEKVLQDRCKYWPDYIDELCKMFVIDDLRSGKTEINWSKMVHATASQRAEAFLKALGLWKD